MLISTKKKYFISLSIDFVLANSADPDEMPYYVAFHLGLHCLSKYRFMCFRSQKGLNVSTIR